MAEYCRRRTSSWHRRRPGRKGDSSQADPSQPGCCRSEIWIVPGKKQHAACCAIGVPNDVVFGPSFRARQYARRFALQSARRAWLNCDGRLPIVRREHALAAMMIDALKRVFVDNKASFIIGLVGNVSERVAEHSGWHSAIFLSCRSILGFGIDPVEILEDHEHRLDLAFSEGAGVLTDSRVRCRRCGGSRVARVASSTGTSSSASNGVSSGSSARCSIRSLPATRSRIARGSSRSWIRQYPFSRGLKRPVRVTCMGTHAHTAPP